jgi:hypothetical protein
MMKYDLADKRLLMDADTIGHFCKAQWIGSLKFILNGQLYILEEVEEDLTSRLDDQHRLDVLQAIRGGVLTRMVMPESATIQQEFTRLCRIRVASEAACLAVARYTPDTVVVTNLRCLQEYCQRYGITVIDTVDLLWVAYNQKVMADDDIGNFVRKVRGNGGRLTDQALGRLPDGVQLLLSRQTGLTNYNRPPMY